MKDRLVIISNERFYFDGDSFYCDNIAEKTLPDEFENKFLVSVVGRYSKKKKSHRLNLNNLNQNKFLIFYLFSILKKIIEGKSKFLILSITPYTFLATLLFIFSKKKPMVYLRSDGYQEYKSILGFYGPILYSTMFNLVSMIGNFISCREYILKKKTGKLVSPSELTENWTLNTTQSSLDYIKLLYVGRIKVEKGIFSLLELIKGASQEFTLSIVGASEQSRSKINQDNVNIFPIEIREKNLIKYYDEHNIFVLPSFTEGHPMVLLESLARLRPVIIFEEIKHVAKNYKGIFVSKRNSINFLENIEYIKKNYAIIQQKMRSNKLPTKNMFIKEFYQIILDHKQ